MNPAQQLQRAGLSLTLTPGGQLLVRPKTLITDDIRAFVAMHRTQIVDSLKPAANDPEVPGNLGTGFVVGAAGAARPAPRTPARLVPTPAPTPPAPRKVYKCAASDETWRERDRAYQAHHFQCPACIAAGHGRGLRCPDGLALLEGAQC